MNITAITIEAEDNRRHWDRPFIVFLDYDEQEGNIEGYLVELNRVITTRRAFSSGTNNQAFV